MNNLKKFLVLFILVIGSLFVLSSCTEEETQQLKDGISNAVNDYLNNLGNDIIDDIDQTDNSSAASGNTLPDISKVPEETPSPEPTQKVTSTPEPTKDVTSTPEPTKEITSTPEPTKKVTSTPEPTKKVTSTPEPTPTKQASGKNYLRFRNYKLLDQHYEKHGKEMGFANREDYEAAAAAVVVNPDVLHKTEAEDGDDVYYLESTNEFVIVSQDGYIRTYFLPSGGKAYYDRQ